VEDTSKGKQLRLSDLNRGGKKSSALLYLGGSIFSLDYY